MIGEKPVLKKETGCSAKNCVSCPFIEGCYALYEAEMVAYTELNLKYVDSLRKY